MCCAGALGGVSESPGGGSDRPEAGLWSRAQLCAFWEGEGGGLLPCRGVPGASTYMARGAKLECKSEGEKEGFFSP